MNVPSILLLSFALGLVSAQVPEPAAPPKEAPSTYALGPDDQLMVRVLDMDEISSTGQAPIRIDSRGNITIPMIGRVKAQGLTTEQLSEEIETRLKKFLNDPDVSVYLVEMRSQPVSILGAVMQPGVHQLQGRKTLFEALSLAGGLKPEAGYTVKITRKQEWGRIPLPTATDDATGQFSVASVSVKSIMEAKNPEENILIKPYDVISVPKAELVYVVGAVKKPGGFMLGERETISAMQALSLAEGFDRTAATKNVKIMRAVPGTDQRKEISVDMKLIMAGKGPDVPLRADDILFIPTSMPKNASIRAAEAAIQIGTGMAIYGRL